jgi:hypothetical protein
VRKDLKDIDQSLRNDVLETQEEYADLFGMDPYDAGLFFWGCIYEQIIDVFGSPDFAEYVMHDLILSVLGDDRICEDLQSDFAKHRIDRMKEDLTVDEALEDFGRMTKRVVIAGRIDMIRAMKEMLFRHEKAVRGIQKVLDKMLKKPGYIELFEEFLPECRYDREYCEEIVSSIIKTVNKRLSEYRKIIRKAAGIVGTATDIEIERGRSYGFE